MGVKNNVNPNHYKEDGRERPGQDIDQERNKQEFARAEAKRRSEKDAGGSKFIPGNTKSRDG